MVGEPVGFLDVRGPVGFLEVRVRPANKMRRIVFDVIPYFQGTRPKYELITKRLNGYESPQDVYCCLEFKQGDSTGWQVLRVTGLKEGEERSYKVGGWPLSFTGDAFIRVTDKKEPATGIKPMPYIAYYSFNVTNRAWLGLTIIAGIVAGSVAALGNLLVYLIA